MTPQSSRCSSWCGHPTSVAVRPVLTGVKNRYWPLWYLLWLFAGWCTLQSIDRPLVTPSKLPNSTLGTRIHKLGEIFFTMWRLRALLISYSLDVRFPTFVSIGIDDLHQLHRCDKTAWFHVFYFTFATLFAQAAVTLRFFLASVLSRREPLTTYLEYTLSRRTIDGSAPAFLL